MFCRQESGGEGVEIIIRICDSKSQTLLTRLVLLVTCYDVIFYLTDIPQRAQASGFNVDTMLCVEADGEDQKESEGKKSVPVFLK